MAYQELDTLPPWRSLDAHGTAPQWAGAFPPPAIGADVVVTVNGCGPGVVVGYFTQDDYLGVRVRLTAPPEFFVRQNPPGALAHAFGPEMRNADAPWYVCRLRSAKPWGRGFHTLAEAVAWGAERIAANAATAFVVLDGQPSDGAKVVCRFDPAGLGEG